MNLWCVQNVEVLNQLMHSSWTAPKRAVIHRNVKHVDIPKAGSGRHKTVNARTWPNGDIGSELLQIIEKVSNVPKGTVHGGKFSTIKGHRES
jgi:hypothetical protein